MVRARGAHEVLHAVTVVEVAVVGVAPTGGIVGIYVLLIKPLSGGATARWPSSRYLTQ